MVDVEQFGTRAAPGLLRHGPVRPVLARVGGVRADHTERPRQCQGGRGRATVLLCVPCPFLVSSATGRTVNGPACR